MPTVRWHSDTEPFLLADALDTLSNILRSASEQGLDWIVIDREHGMYMYAYRFDELAAFVSRYPEKEHATAMEALDLHEGFVSQTVPADNKPESLSGEGDDPIHYPSMIRLVSVNDRGLPISIGEIDPFPGQRTEMFSSFVPEMPVGAAPEWEDTNFVEHDEADAQQQQQMDGEMEDSGDEAINLGRTRGVRSRPGGPTAPAPGSGPPDAAAVAEQKLDVTISAECPDEIQVDKEGILSIRLELTEGAQPLAQALRSVQITAREDVDAIVTVDPLVLEVIGPDRRHLAPPSENAPSTDFFLLRGKQAGATRVSVEFFQGGTELGSLTFSLMVVAETAAPTYSQASGHAMPRNPSDDDSLTLFIRESSGGASRRLIFLVTNKHLDMYVQEFESRPLKDAEAASNATLRYVRTIYKRLVEQVLERQSDLKLLDVMLQGIGTDLSRQLLPDEFVRKLWPVRDRIGVVQITSFEPHLPWELVRLQHPDTQEIDDRYLAEYGLVRRFSGIPGRTELRSDKWGFLVGEYPSQPDWALGSEVDVLEQVLADRGVRTTRIQADPIAIYETLSQPDFDVLYIACHGETDLEDIEHTTLSINERTLRSGEMQLVNIDTTTVRGVASLRDRRPIVFLNACETAQQTTSLSDWGGWPRTFWEAGAGAYIGTSWSVLEKPAIAFATAFQTALFEGQTLAEASRTARQAAKESGDSSWLAYVVYGTPSARLVSDEARA
jgi:hypothetical protein